MPATTTGTPFSLNIPSLSTDLADLFGTYLVPNMQSINTYAAHKGTAQTFSALQTFSAGLNVTGGSVGVNTASPGSTLDVKGTLRLSGSTSGYVGFSPPSVAGSTTYTLPSADGTAGAPLITSGAAVLSFANFTLTQSTAAPNATIYANRVQVLSSVTDTDIVLSPKGSGGFLANLPDNTTVGGNKRGTYAVDLQIYPRTLNTQVAAGTASVIVGGALGTIASTASYGAIIGGSNNSVSGTYGAVLGGLESVITSGGTLGATLGGRGAVAYSQGMVAYASQYRAVAGDAQSTLQTLRGTTTAASAVILTADGSGTPAFAALGAGSTNVPGHYTSNSVVYYRIVIIANAYGATTGSALYEYAVVSRRIGLASTTVLDYNTLVRSNVTAGGITGVAVAITANTTLGTLAISCTGLAATNIAWVALVESVECR